MFSFWPTGIPIGLFGLVLNIPLTIVGIKILGPRFGIKTIIGFVLTNEILGEGFKSFSDKVSNLHNQFKKFYQ